MGELIKTAGDIDEGNLNDVLADGGDIVEDEEEESDFSSGFSDGGGTEDDDDEGNGKEGSGDGAGDDIAGDAIAPVIDGAGGEGGDGGVKEEAKELTPEEQIAELQAKLRTSQSKVGEYNSKLINERKKNQAPAAEVPKAPTATDLKDAMGNNEKLVALKEEFPEIGDALQDIVNQATSGVMESMPTAAKLDDLVKAGIAEAKGGLMLDMKHSGWETTVVTEEFVEFAYEGGPNVEERGLYFNLRDGKDPRADKFFDALIEKYPIWGDEKGRLLQSGSHDDAIDILDQYSASRTAQNEGGDTVVIPPAKKGKVNLARSVAATKSTSTPAGKVTDTEEDDFVSGFRG